MVCGLYASSRVTQEGAGGADSPRAGPQGNDDGWVRPGGKLRKLLNDVGKGLVASISEVQPRWLVT